MSEQVGFFVYAIPNYLLAAAMYTLLARYILALIFKPDSQLVIWRVFCQLTDPILNVVRAVTPAVASNGLVLVLAIIWTIFLRVLLVLLVLKYGIAPKAGG